MPRFLRPFFFASACALNLPAFAAFADVPASGSVLPYHLLEKAGTVSVFQGGFGSSAYQDPENPNRFYALTDRGPNADSPNKGEKVFVVRDYSPRIGHFAVAADGKISLLNSIIFTTPEGKPMTGLPNPEGYGATGEKAVDLDGHALGTDVYGIDSEGLVVMPDGSFYVSDEYGPHIVHFSKAGKQLLRLSPLGLKSNSSAQALPAVLALRRPNRGMEGLAITPDHETLVGIMQSTLYNPSKKAIKNKSLTRILTFNLKTGATAQYLYRQEKYGLSNSEIRAIDATHFLVDERDGHMPGGDKPAHKRLYEINLQGATDVNGDARAKNGLLIDGKPLETLSWDELAAAGIKPVQKRLVLDMEAANHYPHDKLEGMFFVGNNHQRLAVLNDDDFSIDAGKHGGIVQKILPRTQQIDHGTLYVVPIQVTE